MPRHLLGTLTRRQNLTSGYETHQKDNEGRSALEYRGPVGRDLRFVKLHPFHLIIFNTIY